MKRLYNIFIENLYSNLNFDFEKHLFNHLTIEHNYSYVCESYGLFPNLQEIIDFVFEFLIIELKKSFKQEQILKLNYSQFVTEQLKINENYNSLIEKLKNSVYESKQIECFFNNLIIKVIKSNNSINGEYYPQDNNLINDKLDNCVILLYISNKFKNDDLKSILAHELTHAYEDYCRQKLLNTNLYNLDKSIISKAKSKFKSKNFLEQLVSKYLYFSDKQELNAYISSFSQYMNNISFKGNIYSTFEKAWESILNSNIYKEYASISEIIEILENTKDLEYIKPELLKVYNDFTNQSCTKLNKFYNNWHKVSRKLQKTLTNMVYARVKETVDKMY